MNYVWNGRQSMNNDKWEASGSLGDDIDAMIKKMRSCRYRLWNWWQGVKYKIRVWLLRKKPRPEKVIKYSMLDMQYRARFNNKINRMLLRGDSESEKKKEDTGMETQRI